MASMTQFTDWLPVTVGRSAAEVRRSPDGSTYVKIGSGATLAELAAERDRIVWLGDSGVPGPSVLDWVSGPDHAAMVTSTVPGVPLTDLTVSPASIAALAEALGWLHRLEVARCPFDARLAVLAARARANVAAGLVDESDFDGERLGRSAADILGDLEAALPAAEELEAEDLAVTHGDACLPNVLVDPATLRPTGLVDLGRLGVSDRHRDLALAERSLAHNASGALGDAVWRQTALHPASDARRLAFYRLLDEFF